jgi:hypothetical protein
MHEKALNLKQRLQRSLVVFVQIDWIDRVDVAVEFDPHTIHSKTIRLSIQRKLANQQKIHLMACHAMKHAVVDVVLVDRERNNDPLGRVARASLQRKRQAHFGARRGSFRGRDRLDKRVVVTQHGARKRVAHGPRRKPDHEGFGSVRYDQTAVGHVNVVQHVRHVAVARCCSLLLA